jgi:ElaB/YqjD/DUF883 family membrane-anchored ribosome-binding protein
MYESTSTYLGLVQETATLVVDEMAAANQRTMNYLKSVLQIAGRAESESPLRSAYERAEAFVSLTARELETSLRSNLEVTEKLMEQGKKLQQQSYETAREIADKALSSAKQAVEAASDRIETLTEKVEAAEVPAKHASASKKRVAAE